MNKDQIYGLMRTLGVALMTYLVSSGTLTSDQASALVNAATQATPVLVALGLAAYGVYKKRAAGTALSADQIPGVTVTVNEKTAAPAVVDAARAKDNSIILIKDTTA